MNQISTHHPLVLLHGLGQTSADWDSTVEALGASEDVRCPDLLDLLDEHDRLLFSASDYLTTRSRTYPNLVAAVEGYLDAISGPVNLVGLSLGGTIALEYAHKHPEKVASLVLVGAQFKMPVGLMKAQNVVFRMMPAKFFNKMGVDKADMISLATSTIGIDLTDDLKRITCPVLVLCGSKDSANKKAAIGLSERLPNAELGWVDGAGHEVNKQKPEELAKLLSDFIASH